MHNENQHTSVVALGEISLHKAYTSPVMVENFIQTEFMLKTPAKHLTKKAVLTLLELHPVQVMYFKREGYVCVGGVRSLSIARNCLAATEKISVTQLPNVPYDKATDRCLTDILLSATCLSVESRESLFHCHQISPENIRNELFKRSDSPTHLPGLFGITRETLRIWKQKV